MRSLVSAMLPIASSLKCGQIRRFLKFSVTKILSKEAPKYGKTWATWKHIALKLKIDFTTFWQQFGQIWAIFYFNVLSHWPNSMKICQNRLKNKIGPNTKYSLKQLPKTFKLFAKAAKFRQIWSH